MSCAYMCKWPYAWRSADECGQGAVVVDALYTGDLDPAAATTPAELARLLRTVHLRADRPSLRVLEARTRHDPTPLSKTVVSEMLKGARFPRKTVMVAFLRACGERDDRMEAWRRAWDGIAVHAQESAAGIGSVASLPDAQPAARRPGQAGMSESAQVARAESDHAGRASEEITQPAPNVLRTGAVDSDRTGTQPRLRTDFLESADVTGGGAGSLLVRLGRREIERVTSFVQQVPGGREITYDGEDREWLLGLTQEVERSMEAISLAAVDTPTRSFDGGLWTSDLGVRYLESQRQAIDRGVSVRRIFVYEDEGLTRDELFLRIVQMQRDAGIDVRILEYGLIPEWLRGMIFEFVIFDDEVSYEMLPSASLHYATFRPIIFRTMLVPTPSRIKDLGKRFGQLWTAADPEGQIGG
jgi:hypothetical protein